MTLNTTENPRQIALELLRQHGKAASAFQILESGYRFWFFEPGGVRSGVVAYRVCNGCAVVVGQPVCRDAELKLCVAEFMGFLRRSNLNLLMVGVEAWALGYLDLKAQGLEAFKIGEQPEWACQDYSLQASTRRSLRTQVNRARNKGVEVRALSRQENNQLYPAQKLAIEHILARWMERRPIAILKFMVSLEPLSNSSEKLYFLAEREGEPIGFLAAVPVFGRQGWFFEDVIRVSEAPNGTSELLIHEAMSFVQARGESFVTLGLAPLAGVADSAAQQGSDALAVPSWVRWLKVGYDFDGLLRFKKRIGPDRWVDQYALKDVALPKQRAFRALIAAFVSNSIMAFMFDSARRLLGQISERVWALICLLQCCVLVPWTLMLAIADGQVWFGDSSIQVAWLVFNGFLTASLVGLSWLLARRHPAAPRLSLFLAGTTLTDLILSSVQAFMLHQSVSGWSALFVALGLAGPALATLLLWLTAVEVVDGWS